MLVHVHYRLTEKVRNEELNGLGRRAGGEGGGQLVGTRTGKGKGEHERREEQQEEE